MMCLCLCVFLSSTIQQPPGESGAIGDSTADDSSSSALGEPTAAAAASASVAAASVEGETLPEVEDAVAKDGEGEKENAAEEEEVEDDGETVFLPTGASGDFRLFRARLRAGSDEKWREQLRRNVNEEQLKGQDAWAHELSTPEKGCLIIAKSSVFNFAQTYFNEVSTTVTPCSGPTGHTV